MDALWSKGIVVGVDGSVGSTHALDWAVDAAVEHGCPLRVVHAYAPVISFVPPPLPLTSAALHDLGEQILQRALDHVAERSPSLAHVTSDLRLGTPARVLLDASSSSHLVVVGRRGLGTIERLALGSVSSVVASRAAGMAAVVPEQAPAAASGRVVVGVDSETDPSDVLEVAYEEARARSLPLLAVNAWEASSSLAMLVAEDWSRRDELAGEVRSRVTEHLSGWAEKYSDVPSSVEVQHGPVLDVLMANTTAVDLAVVGGRRHAHILGLLLGSVTDTFIRHAPCPVVVVHHSTDVR